MEMLMVMGLYMALALWFVASGIADLVRKGPGRDLAAAVAMVVMGGLLPVMAFTIRQIPSDTNVVLAIAVILAAFGVVYALGWGAGKLVERPLLRSWERRRAAAEAA
jgi:hypothetical protein